MEDKFIHPLEFKELLMQAEFCAPFSIGWGDTVKCFYCGTENTGLKICKSCNGPLEDGYKFVGLYYGEKLFLDENILYPNPAANKSLHLTPNRHFLQRFWADIISIGKCVLGQTRRT